jgi:hypothetical protein
MYNGFIQMLPNETFKQISNSPVDIAFGGNLKVELINDCQEVLLDVTDKFNYNEFTDRNGIRQIAFEFGNIGVDFYYELVFLKLTHTVSDSVFYSNGFLISDNLIEETTLFEYFDKPNEYQNIRLQCFKNDIDIVTDSTEYTQLSGRVVSLRKIITQVDKYKMYTCDFFTYNRLVYLLNSGFIYLNGFRISNKPQPTKGERIEDSNFFDVDFDANPTEEVRLNTVLRGDFLATDFLSTDFYIY